MSDVLVDLSDYCVVVSDGEDGDLAGKDIGSPASVSWPSNSRRSLLESVVTVTNFFAVSSTS